MRLQKEDQYPVDLGALEQAGLKVRRLLLNYLDTEA